MHSQAKVSASSMGGIYNMPFLSGQGRAVESHPSALFATSRSSTILLAIETSGI
jgi:hypothetical protein